MDGLWKGVDVKQVFGLEWGRSALTGVGFILLEGLDALKKKKTENMMYYFNTKWSENWLDSFQEETVDLRWQNGRWANRREVLHIA